jgi:hypothetical protein
MILRERWGGWKREPFTSESRKHMSVLGEADAPYTCLTTTRPRMRMQEASTSRSRARSPRGKATNEHGGAPKSGWEEIVESCSYASGGRAWGSRRKATDGERPTPREDGFSMPAELPPIEVDPRDGTVTLDAECSRWNRFAMFRLGRKYVLG